MSDHGDHEHARLRQARALDEATLAGIYDDYHPAIYRYIYRQVADEETARDLSSDVFHRFLKAIHKGKGPNTHLSAWLYRTAHNAVVDYCRRQKHRRDLPLDDECQIATTDPMANPENQLTVIQIRDYLLQLSPDQQQVIYLKFLEGMSNQEVADVLGKPVGAVKSLQHRALAALRRHMVADGQEARS